ncbi:MAG: hypothetical protein U0470_07795 [Anaerolineae bacterium]
MRHSRAARAGSSAHNGDKAAQHTSTRTPTSRACNGRRRPIPVGTTPSMDIAAARSSHQRPAAPTTAASTSSSTGPIVRGPRAGPAPSL